MYYITTVYAEVKIVSGQKYARVYLILMVDFPDLTKNIPLNRIS